MQTVIIAILSALCLFCGWKWLDWKFRAWIVMSHAVNKNLTPTDEDIEAAKKFVIDGIFGRHERRLKHTFKSFR